MRTAILTLTGLLAGGPTPAARADGPPVSLERALVRAAPDVLKFCRDRGYKNVGVLKFLVHEGGRERVTDSAGTLNRTIARQLEMGLILANDPRKPIGIVEDASAVAARTPGANHLTKEGRLKLFAPAYPLAWGKDDVKPDAFLTGLVGVSADLKALDVKLLAFDAATNKLEPVGPALTAINDPRKLSEIGESFSRGAFDDGATEPAGGAEAQAKKETAVMENAALVKRKAVPNPAADGAAPVRLELLYDGHPVPVEFRDGKAFVPEPAVGQRVAIRLRRNGPGGVLACVLKVNGENTLFREKAPDLHCRKWLLYPEDAAGVAVVGFQKDEKTSEQFRVLSRAESKEREVDYGSDVGTISLTVFREQKGKAPRGDLTDETQGTKVLERAELPARKADNFDALTAQLLDDANRGLLAQGTAVDSGIRVVKSFVADPTPVMGLTLVYYKK